MGIELGPPPRRPRCFYCGSVMMPHEIKCNACNAPVRKAQSVQERQVSFSYMQTMTGFPAVQFERERLYRRRIIHSWRRRLR